MNANKLKKRLPPGQRLTEKFPVLQKGEVVHIDRVGYSLEIAGEIEKPLKLSLREINSLKDAEIMEDIHCVTTWSKFDTKWGGIFFKSLINLVKPRQSVKFVEFLGADSGFSTTVPIDAINVDNAILAFEYKNQPISDSHGGPVRAIIPDLYFYKSAKWIIKITFLEKDRLGYWEKGGYSNKADPWKEQRYSSND